METSAMRYPPESFSKSYLPGNVRFKRFGGYKESGPLGTWGMRQASLTVPVKEQEKNAYAVQRGMSTYAYKIQGIKRYKSNTVQLPRGGSVMRVVGTIGDDYYGGDPSIYNQTKGKPDPNGAGGPFGGGRGGGRGGGGGGGGDDGGGGGGGGPVYTWNTPLQTPTITNPPALLPGRAYPSPPSSPEDNLIEGPSLPFIGPADISTNRRAPVGIQSIEPPLNLPTSIEEPVTPLNLPTSIEEPVSPSTTVYQSAPVSPSTTVYQSSPESPTPQEDPVPPQSRFRTVMGWLRTGFDVVAEAIANIPDAGPAAALTPAIQSVERTTQLIPRIQPGSPEERQAAQNIRAGIEVLNRADATQVDSNDAVDRASLRDTIQTAVTNMTNQGLSYVPTVVNGATTVLTPVANGLGQVGETAYNAGRNYLANRNRPPPINTVVTNRPEPIDTGYQTAQDVPDTGYVSARSAVPIKKSAPITSTGKKSSGRYGLSNGDEVVSADLLPANNQPVERSRPSADADYGPISPYARENTESYWTDAGRRARDESGRLYTSYRSYGDTLRMRLHANGLRYDSDEKMPFGWNRLRGG